MLPNGCRCSPEKFGGRNRSHFSQEKKSALDNLTGAKKFLNKSLSPGSQFQKNLTFGNSLKNGVQRLEMLPEKFGGRNRRLLSQDKKSAQDNLTGRRRFFRKKSISPGVTISEKMCLSAIHSKIVSNRCKCSAESFGGLNRSLFITGQEINPRQLNRQ
ncbi:Hypothetical predicted protein [Podarcis lilfordi]|uniref:Uncharacterized protein n=1 Tax=Podarcis lilfordi TaxID=74358 RepID=A0AA35QQM0_9SAUR|nr:Hypothetical predicted protein [Podarcis lilfordi]